MTDDDGFITEAESTRLQREADALLRQDAKDKGYIKPKGKYGFGKYSKAAGILTPHDIVTIRKHEIPGLFYDVSDEDQGD